MRSKHLKIGGTLLGIAGVLTAAACGSTGGPSSSGGALAASQVLKFPTFQDPKTWDPGKMDAEVDTEFMQNVYNNLFRFDDGLNLVPDIATDVPTTANGGISADGLTITVHLKQNVKFSNGDPVTAKDVLYSFNRGTDLQGSYASNNSGIAGFADAQTGAGSPPGKKSAASSVLAFRQNIETGLAANDPKFMMSGLTAPDGPTGFTVKFTLSSPCGWCLTAWALQGSTGAIVDEKVIMADPVDWWSKPGEQIGTGAFNMTAYTAKQSIVFKAVPNWWGSPKPTLTEIDVDIKDPATAATDVAAWEQGSYDIIGYGGNTTIIGISDLLRIKQSSSESSQLLSAPKGRTTWVSFNVGHQATGGPFYGTSAAALGLRKAFALAVDKTALATTVCHNFQCSPATNGLITKGLVGSGADGSDPLSKFDATMAQSLLAANDPTGALTKGLKYSYNSGGINDPVASFLQGQWHDNLHVDVALDPHPDASAFISDRLGGKFMMSRDGWQFDYNHPQDWYDNLWGYLQTASDSNTSGFDDPTYDMLLKQADGKPIDQALPLYNQMAKILQDNAVYIPLYYSQANILIHSYVKGAGTNSQADFYWNEISLQQH